MRVVETSDGSLVDRARNGDAASFEELFRRHREPVARTVYLVVADAETAQDLAQEAFGIAWSDLAKLRDAARFRGWTTGIALNLARRRWRRREIPVARVVSGEEPPEPEDAMVVREAVRRLPMAIRAVVALRYYADLGDEDIAAALGIPVGTVKSRLSRGRGRLATALGTEVGR